MKIPDKLFVSSDSFGFMSAYYIENHPPYGEEYIRKDTLLEWVKEMKEQVSIGLNAYDMGEENGKAEILNKLIDKLNSL